MYAIQVLNLSTLISQADLSPIVAALQTQLDRDFVPAYGPQYAAELTLTESDNGKTPLYIIDSDASAPPGALAWHTTDGVGRAYGIIPMAILRRFGADPAPTIGHELMELLADPECTRTASAVWPAGSSLAAQLAYEACDPVESDTYAIGEINCSNFVLPAWYQPGSTGPWDFCQNLTGPLTMTHGGYLQWTRGGAWHQAQEAHLRDVREAPNYFRRHQRRRRLRHEQQHPGFHARLAHAEKIARAASPAAVHGLINLVTQEIGPHLDVTMGAFVAQIASKATAYPQAIV